MGCLLPAQDAEAQYATSPPPGYQPAYQISDQPPSPHNPYAALAIPASPADSLPPSETIPPGVAGPILIDPATSPPPKLWEGGFEFGLNGTEGNSDTFNIRIGADAKHKGPGTLFSFDLDYKKETQSDAEISHRALFDWRNEWLLGESPWSLFLHGTVEYDEFQTYDLRVSLDTGIGYEFFSGDVNSLKGRFGSGVSREFGGSDDRYVPEAVFGLDYSHQLTKRQKLTASVDYFPDWTAFEDYRLNAKVNWVVVIDAEANLSLKLGVSDRYDSTPDGALPNDLDYSAVLLWNF